MPILDFKGKQFVYAHHLTVPFRQLNISNKKSLSKDGPSLDDNLIIHGDNLHALKALLPQYAGKIRCIYIDPPYNTGKEGWCYNDKVNSPLIKEWLKKSANPVDKEDLERHDKWLCMMWPRLLLLSELLAEDGVIFISIDDNELQNLKCILDEIFLDTNCLGTIIWKNVTDNNPTNIAVEHEYIVCYAKNRAALNPVWKSTLSAVKDKLIEVGDKFNSKHNDPKALQAAYSEWFKENKAFLWPLDRYKYIDEGGVYTGSQSVHNPGKEGYRYDIPHPVTHKPCKEPLMGYRFPEETAKKFIEKGKVLFGSDENKIIELKIYARDYADKLPSVISLDGRQGAYELRSIFPESKKTFDNPKTVQLIEQLISFIAKPGDIVLDSFAGSGTTAHAVLALNRTDEGDRKFILVECENYADKITAERVRRVVKGVPDSNDQALRNGLGGSFTFCDLGDEVNIENLLKGDKLPAHDELARYAFYTSTGLTLEEVQEGADYLVGETERHCVYLIYKPDIDFLRSGDSALNSDLADSISKASTKKSKGSLVFATHKYMSQKDLTALNVTYCQLPYAIHRIMGG